VDCDGLERSRERSAGRRGARRRLGELARALERVLPVLERTAAGAEHELVAPHGPAVRSEVGAEPDRASLEDLVESLDALRVSLETESRRTQELLRSAPVLGGATLLETRRRHTDVDWPALEQLEQSWRADPQATERAQRFSTARDLLEAYGPPTEIQAHDGVLKFRYKREGGTEWSFQLADGFVVATWVDLRE